MVKQGKFWGILQFVSFLLCFQSLSAQQATFIHIQSENSKPFFLYWNGNSFPSSSSGNLIIPKVPQGEIGFEIGFAPNSPELYRFNSKVTDKPLGFTLKQSLDNGWSIFDMISFEEIKGATVKKEIVKDLEPEIPSIPEPKKEVATPLISEGKKEVIKVLPIAAVPIVATVLTKPVISYTAVKDLSIEKIFDKAGSAGIDQVYILSNNGKKDTIALFIPALMVEKPAQTAFQQKLMVPVAQGKSPANKPEKVSLYSKWYLN